LASRESSIVKTPARLDSRNKAVSRPRNVYQAVEGRTANEEHVANAEEGRGGVESVERTER